MNNKKEHEELTRKMYEKAKEIVEMLKEAGVKTDFHHIAIGMKDLYIRVELSTEDGTYEICTIGEKEKPRLTFKEA